MNKNVTVRYDGSKKFGYVVIGGVVVFRGSWGELATFILGLD